jgi:hypothetical protein
MLKNVRLWALKSDGPFPVRVETADPMQTEYMKWISIKDDCVFTAQVFWAKVKSVERAIEKIVRT